MFSKIAGMQEVTTCSTKNGYLGAKKFVKIATAKNKENQLLWHHRFNGYGDQNGGQKVEKSSSKFVLVEIAKSVTTRRLPCVQL